MSEEQPTVEVFDLVDTTDPAYREALRAFVRAAVEDAERDEGQQR